MPEHPPRPAREPDDYTPSVPWDDSGVAPAEAAPAGGDATSVVPTVHDGETHVMPTGSPWRPTAPAPDATPGQAPWTSPAAGGRTVPAVPPSPALPASGNPWATQPSGQYPPGGSPPPGAPWGTPYAAAPGAPAPRKRSRAALWIVLAAVVVLALVGVVVAALVSRGPDIELLYAQCEEGNPAACEDLYQVAEIGSPEEEFGLTCGGRTEGFDSCFDVDMDVPANSWTDGGVTDDGAVTDDDAVDDDAVDGGTTDEGGATDDGGGVTDEGGGVTDEGGGGATDEGGDDLGGEPFTYGDDAYLDGLWDACAAGDMAACDDLYMDSPFDSEYERFGDTCGDTTTGGTWCDPDREE